MVELYFESLNRIKELEITNEKKWNKIAYKENLLSSKTIMYLSGMRFETLSKNLILG